MALNPRITDWAGRVAIITPDQAARDIVAGWVAGRFEIHFPKRFTIWLKLLRQLSDGMYFRAMKRVTGP